MVKSIFGLFFAKDKGQLSLVLLLVEAKFSICNLFKLASYGHFGFSRSDLDGNNLAKGLTKKSHRLNWAHTLTSIDIKWIRKFRQAQTYEVDQTSTDE